ncbi:MAG: cyanophycinase, partial [Blastocatellia bacterium]
LVIVGGGRVGPEIWDRFIQLAGGPGANFVYIPTASEDRTDGQPFTIGDGAPLAKFTNLVTLHTRKRAEADTEAFAAPLKKATGVWIGGGRQWRLVDSYAGTRTYKELQNVLKRGGVIGGSSAGASIQASYLVRGAREGNTVMMAPGYEQGFGFLRNTAIDQHLNTRKRELDLAPVIQKHPDLLGIGLDESTAIVVEGNQFEVIGAGRVLINDGREHDGKPYYEMTTGARFDLKKRLKK